MSTLIDEAALSEVERVKLESAGLRGTLAEELENESSHLSDVGRTLIKFHGSYEQEDRDQRKERKRAGLEPAYSFMIRSKLPGGVLDAQQYLVHDDLADRFGNGTLRITTRQGFQFHGVLKGDLRSTIHDLNEAMVTTLGACGDVVRNVVSCPAPVAGGFRREAYEMARRLSDETLPASRAYHELWVEGVKISGGEPEPDALYGERYLPRKFKVAFGYADDNCTDVYANDLGFVAIPAGDRVLGYNVVVGGGLGQTHGKEETFPRLADPLCFVESEELIEVAKAIIAVQRDYGNRANRRRARLKYLIHEQGVAWFRGQVEAYLGRAVRDPYPIEVNDIHDHLGWHRQADGRWFYGIYVQNGRVHDTPTLQLRTALRRIVEGFHTGVHLTTQQNLLLTDIADEHRDGVESILAEHGVMPKEKLSLARRWSMACPALPTCGLAVAESERALPGVIDEIEAELASLGLAEERITIRMTGCPNGCARPYTADIAFVGRSLGKYLMYVGGNSQGTRLATPFKDLVPVANVVEVLRPLFTRFRDERLPGEGFGDFCTRVGVESLRSAEAAA